MLRHTLGRRCAPIIRVGGSGPAGGNKDIAVPKTHDSAHRPTIINSTWHENRSLELAQEEEERRVARQEHLFEDMLVFKGGAIADHDTLGTRMLMRDFVHYSMFHYKWGYYPKLARKYRELMTSGFYDPIPFGQLRNQADYEEYVARVSEASPTFATPPALFQPYYGWVLAEYMITVMRSKFHPSEPLIIYEVGAGAGTLAVSILNFLAEQYPDVYAQCEYHCIELSSYAIPVLRKRLVHHYHKAHIHHISIHNWRNLEPRRCFVLGVELLSNMPHDNIVWADDGSSYETYMYFEQDNNLATATERWEATTDPLILRYLRYSNWMKEESYNALRVLCLTDGQNVTLKPKYHRMEPTIYDPWIEAMTKSLNVHNPFRVAWLPTGSTVMLETLAEFFPRHHALFADWGSVQGGINGFQGPLVQAKIRIAKNLYARRMCDNLTTNGGMVDLCFPTDFDRMVDTYRNICGEHKEITNMTHPDFWKTFGGEKTSLFTTRSGYNPMIEDFGVFNVFATHHPAEM